MAKGPKGALQTDIRNLDWENGQRMCPGAPGPGLAPDCKKSLYRRMGASPKLSPPQTCAALIDPREPYKLASGTWTGKMAKLYALGLLALGWHQTPKSQYIEEWTPDRNWKMAKVCALGLLALGWHQTPKSQYIEEWTPDRNCPHLKLVVP
ncbi:hypothetical protein RLOC_00003263 [Lonchura striata]|uniref:Uncharacterized protein n=1 Tax=Lonchura striata TaxID=40157 RepID=A0A218UCZ9_9PASE|nr:hypothetical protein RLOC_00003263 [Lonchura striata domestica]